MALDPSGVLNTDCGAADGAMCVCVWRRNNSKQVQVPYQQPVVESILHLYLAIVTILWCTKSNGSTVWSRANPGSSCHPAGVVVVLLKASYCVVSNI